MNSGLLFVPTILFLVIVAPIWIVMHYNHKGKMTKGISSSEREGLEYLLENMDKLTERVETLESILTENHGDRRSRDSSSRQRQSKENENV